MEGEHAGMPHWFPSSPFRSPAWRWERACWLREPGRRLSAHIDDEWVDRARDFLARGPTQGEPSRRRPTALDPAIQEALDLWHEQEPQKRWLVEGLLLTDVPIEEVARRGSLPVAAVQAFHELFFDVRASLAASDWVLTQAIGWRPWSLREGRQPGAFWKHTAYVAGANALDLVMAITMNQPLPVWCRTPDAAAEKMLRLKCKLTFGAMTARSVAELNQFRAAYERLERLDSSTSTPAPRERPTGGMLPLMQDFLRRLGRRRPTARSSSPSRTKVAAARSARARAARHNDYLKLLTGCES